MSQGKCDCLLVILETSSLSQSLDISQILFQMVESSIIIYLFYT